MSNQASIDYAQAVSDALDAMPMFSECIVQLADLKHWTNEELTDYLSHWLTIVCFYYEKIGITPDAAAQRIIKIIQVVNAAMHREAAAANN